MQVIKKEEIIVRVMNGDHVYILTPIECMSVKELGKRVKAGAVFVSSNPIPSDVASINKENVMPVSTRPRIGRSPQKKTYDKSKLIALYNAGWTYRAIADELGISESVASTAVYRERLEKKNVN